MTTPEPVDPNPDNHDRTDELADELVDQLGCTWCLAGYAPAGTHPILGLVYQTCPHCTDRCGCCDATALFPADTTCPHCLNDALAAFNLTAVFCHTCVGVLAVHPTHEVTT